MAWGGGGSNGLGGLMEWGYHGVGLYWHMDLMIWGSSLVGISWIVESNSVGIS